MFEVWTRMEWKDNNGMYNVGKPIKYQMMY